MHASLCYDLFTAIRTSCEMHVRATMLKTVSYLVSIRRILFVEYSFSSFFFPFFFLSQGHWDPTGARFLSFFSFAIR
jgi:hypothetical protein